MNSNNLKEKILKELKKVIDQITSNVILRR